MCLWIGPRSWTPGPQLPSWCVLPAKSCRPVPSWTWLDIATSHCFGVVLCMTGIASIFWHPHVVWYYCGFLTIPGTSHKWTSLKWSMPYMYSTVHIFGKRATTSIFFFFLIKKSPCGNFVPLTFTSHSKVCVGRCIGYRLHMCATSLVLFRG